MQILMLTGREEGVAGGHQVQRRETGAALARLGHTIRTVSAIDSSADLRGIDIVHAWWPDLTEARKVREANVPLVASTVYIPILTIKTSNGVGSRLQRMRMAAALAGQGLSDSHVAGAEKLVQARTTARLLFETSDLLLPNSSGEAALIRAELGVSTPMHVVPNGFDPNVFNEAGALPWGERQGVVLAARIEPHKNQLALIRALRGAPYDVHIVGGAHPHYPAYFGKCMTASESAPNIHMSGRLDPSGLAQLLRRSRVHVLPSLWETTGLVSLEAAACGCNVVAGIQGHAREYLGETAWYCEDLSDSEIKRVVIEAHDAPQRPALSQAVRESFTWRHAALASVAAYERAIRAHRQGSMEGT